MELSRPRASARVALVALLALALTSAGALAPQSARAVAGIPQSVAASELRLSSSFDGLGFDVILDFDAELAEGCATGWVKPVLYAADGEGFDAESMVLRSLGWREVTEAGAQRIFFRVAEPGAYGVALLTPAVDEACLEGPAEIADGAAPFAEIALVRIPTLNLVPPAITGVAQVGRTLTASVGTWQGPHLEFDYQWSRSGVPIEDASSPEYELTPNDVGATVSVRVTATSPHDAATADAAPTGPVALGTIPSFTPQITGTRTVGAVLTVAVPEGNSYTYQWYRGTTKITGATGGTYTLVSADGGTTIKVVAIASRDGHASLSRTSAATTKILKKIASRTPTISGAVRVGTALKVLPGAWGPAPVTLAYRWSVDGVAVPGATTASYTPRPADLDKTVSVTVTGSKTGYATVATTSAVSVPVARGVISLPKPKISGTAKAGGRLKAVVATTVPSKASLVFEYQWLANGVEIDGATASGFTPDNSLAGIRLSVRVTASNPSYLTRSATSAATAAVIGVLSAPTPVLTGTARIDHTMCVDPGDWTSGAKLRYAWYLSGKKLSTSSRCVKITSPSWSGKRLVAKVTGSKSSYATRTVSSRASAAIVVPNRTGPISLNSCPSWAPIKGNASSKIYHMPGQRFYKVTNPEECFRTEAAARAAGYRKAKV